MIFSELLVTAIGLIVCNDFLHAMDLLFKVNDPDFKWLRFVLFSGWAAGLKIFPDMTDLVSYLVNIETVVVHAE